MKIEYNGWIISVEENDGWLHATASHLMYDKLHQTKKYDKNRFDCISKFKEELVLRMMDLIGREESGHNPY